MNIHGSSRSDPYLRASTLSSVDIEEHDTASSLSASLQDIPPPPPSAPSFKLLFSFLTPKRKLVLLAPAIASSVVAGGIAPFMTYVVGRTFNAFAAFPPTPNATQAAKDALLHGVGLAALELVGLGICALFMSSVTSALWIWTGESNVLDVRRKVYHAVIHNQMEWFDRQMGSDNPISLHKGDPIGAGGLMTKFTRETDDVRAASSLAAGHFIQYLTTALSALVLAFVWSPLLTLVILSAVPFLVIIQGFSQAFATPRFTRERSLVAHAASLVTRVASNISAVKAANAASYEHSLLTRVAVAVNSLCIIWGIAACASQLVAMAMFVQGFWFGAHLVLQGKNKPGDVMGVFWACLIATSNLQMMLPLLVVLAKGKAAAAELSGVISSSQQILSEKAAQYRKVQPLRRITPCGFTGDFMLTNLTFSYPTRPTVPVLRNVNMFFPSRETTFIVGHSGCGKSTIASILLGHYIPALDRGEVLLDEQDLRYLMVPGSINTSLAGSVHWNIALGAIGSGRRIEDVTRAEVEEACRLAMLEGWVWGLEAGYETILAGSGESTETKGGVVLSGGMRQRLALARARLRDPEVLILDESTSALDPVTRHLTTAAIRSWRSCLKKTTIIITHDIASINVDDFVYVMREGCVAEQGFRADLEKADGEWNKMLRQGGLSGYDSNAHPPIYEEVAEIFVSHHEKACETYQTEDKHYSLAPTFSDVRPVTLAIGGWMCNIVTELTTTVNSSLWEKASPHSATLPVVFDRTIEFEGGAARRPTRPSSIPITIPLPIAPSRAYDGHRSLQFSPTRTLPASYISASPSQLPAVLRDDWFETEKTSMKRSAELAIRRREGHKRRRPVAVQTAADTQASQKSLTLGYPPATGLIATLCRVYPTIPAKHLFFSGLFTCLLSGVMTPVFSFFLSRLLFEVSVNPGTSTINYYGAFVLAMAAVDGVVMGLKFFLMETSAIRWVTHLRNLAYSRVLTQDKTWFDSPVHPPAALAQGIIENADDARGFIAAVMGQLVVVVAMMGVGLAWAMVWGWQLTLVGTAIAPVFIGIMALEAGLVAKCEVRNKRAREEVARVYYEAIVNIRSIRAMSLEPVLQSQFDTAISACLSAGSRGAFVEGCSYGIASALIYLAEALLFYVGAVLVANGTYTYLRMVQVLNLVVFTVTIGSQLMVFTQKITKSVQATTELFRFVTLSIDDTSESQGILRPPIMGDLVLQNVSFAYPTEPHTTVLRDFSMRVYENECVAIVGASGCGKSTVAALLQRLYEPTSGTITIGGHQLRLMDVHHLRNHVAVVNQTPNLVDGTIRENIAYGHLGELDDDDVIRAARATHAHDFVMALPQEYDTLVGENAALISGGQAQRLQIARALARPSRLLILDECTSALDGENQRKVLETIRGTRAGCTTVMITHKVEVMRICDRVIVIENGKVAEEGPYEELVRRRGVFAKLASGGEWLGN